MVCLMIVQWNLTTYHIARFYTIAVQNRMHYRPLASSISQNDQEQARNIV